MDHRASQPGRRTTPLAPILVMTGLCSIGTGVVWNGLPFVAEHDYGFTQIGTLGLSLFLGVIYIGGAFTSGAILRRVERRVGPRAALAWLTLTMAVVCLGPGVVDAEWMVWAVTGVAAYLSSLLWPIVESYVSAGRHGPRMRHAIGWWNIVWTVCVGLALVMMAPLMQEDSRHARFAIVALGGLNALAALTLFWFARRPAEHDETESHTHVGPEYRQLLHSARVLLPTSYVLLALISPLMPYRLDELELSDSWKTPLTAMWMFARVAVIVVLWRLPFWHGRWGTLSFAAGAMTVGFVAIVLASDMVVMSVGLIAFGVGQGMVYFAAIYYALAVGRAQIDASGKHEGLIGVGYAGGPLIGIMAIFIADSPRFAVSEDIAIVASALIALAIALFFAARPYFRARTLRRNA